MLGKCLCARKLGEATFSGVLTSEQQHCLKAMCRKASHLQCVRDVVTTLQQSRPAGLLISNVASLVVLVFVARGVVAKRGMQVLLQERRVRSSTSIWI